MKKRFNLKIIRFYKINLLVNAKFTSKSYNSYNSSRWFEFKKPMSFRAFPVKISRFFSLDLISDRKNIVLFYQKKKFGIWFLVLALVKVRFFKSSGQANFFIKNGFIFVNDVKVKSPYFVLNSGDLVEFKDSNFSFSVWKTELFFSNFKQVTVFISIPFTFEISYSRNFFICCF